MKKLTLFTIALTSIFASCTQLPYTGSSSRPSYNLGGAAAKPSVLPQETFYLSDNGVAYVLDIISETVNQDQKRAYSLSPEGYYEVYLGEYLQLDLDRGDTLKLLAPSDITSYELFLQGNTLFFRTIYQGNYRIGIYENGMLVKEIRVNNKLKYKFTEAQIYDIILRNYNNKNLKRTQDAITLHRIAYPNTAKDREFSLYLIELAALNGDQVLFDDEFKSFTGKYTLNNDEILRVLESQRRISRGNFRISPKFLTYNSDNYAFNEQIKNLILMKGNPSPDEIAFVEKHNLYNPSPELSNKIDNLKSGAITPAQPGPETLLPESGRVIEETIISQPSAPLPTPSAPKTEAIPAPAPALNEAAYGEFRNNFSSGKNAFSQENYNEAIIFLERALKVNGNFPEKNEALFYLGQAHSNLKNHQKALDNYLKYSETAKDKAEVFYNIGVTYHELGNINKSKEYLNRVRNEYPDTIWSRRSTIYLMKLN